MEHKKIPADEALNRLVEGNKRFISNQVVNQAPDPDLRKKLAEEGQDPYGIVLTCIDSRVDPTMIFDVKEGDLFTPQSIGNTADDNEIQAVWYAVHACNIRLVLVLSHSSCGAVGHAMKGEKIGQSIDGVVDAIQPAVDTASTEGDHYKNVIVENAKLVAKKFADHPDFKDLIESGELKVVPAYYHLESGEIELLT